MASSKVCLVAALSCFLLFTVFYNSTESASCCMSYSKRQPSLNRILGYNIQPITGSCDIRAIIFFYKDKQQRNRFLCAKPSKPWTMMAMKHVDDRRRKLD
ncbi:C-C motif chemokine 25 [Austrofundulus limnaeus]|uniref:C-C motif chemokine 25 n=1 Tax=Austrofundulus limnaeus TaxID=52670 RepID=A0A2I4AZ77_AUSLI|nr:PREDICTED: C-C motif chemokine 25-like [Austrofundulus limnaeus]